MFVGFMVSLIARSYSPHVQRARGLHLWAFIVAYPPTRAHVRVPAEYYALFFFFDAIIVFDATNNATLVPGTR